MNRVKEFFVCCNSMPVDSEIVINMQEKRRSYSYNTPNKRIFIKRSIGKNPILDLSMNNTNRSTENTPKVNSSIRIKRINDQVQNTAFQNSFDSSIQTAQKSGKIYKDEEQHDVNRQKARRFINFHDYNRNTLESSFFPNFNDNMFELQEQHQIKITNPCQRRIIYQKQDKKRFLLDSQNRNLMRTMNTIIEVIDERSSIPSMEGSQMNEMRQISSKATIKSNLYDKNQSKNLNSPFTDKFDSTMLKESHSKQPLRMTNSQNLLSSERKPNQQLNLMPISKLEMENSIIQKELNALRQEENFLQQQKEYDRKRFQEQHENLAKIRDQYSKKLAQRQIQLTQIKEILNKKQQKLSQ